MSSFLCGYFTEKKHGENNYGEIKEEMSSSIDHFNEMRIEKRLPSFRNEKKS